MRDAIDIQIIRSLQEEMPVTAKPYAAIAEKVGVEEGELLQRIQRLQADGLLRRIGAVLHHRRSGVKANAMVVWDIPDAEVAEMGRRLGACDEVSLCYRRPRRLPSWPYNLFTMVHGHDRAQVEAAIAAMATREGVDHYRHEALFSTRRFKQCGARYTPRQAAE